MPTKVETHTLKRFSTARRAEIKHFTAGIDGLLVEGNGIRIDHGAASKPAIHVSACRVNDPFPCRNLRILNNTVSRGIPISGSPGENNLIKGNKAVGTTLLRIRNEAGAKVNDNQGFEVEEEAWIPHNDRKPRQHEQQRMKWRQLGTNTRIGLSFSQGVFACQSKHQTGDSFHAQLASSMTLHSAFLILQLAALAGRASESPSLEVPLQPGTNCAGPVILDRMERYLKEVIRHGIKTDLT